MGTLPLYFQTVIVLLGLVGLDLALGVLSAVIHGTFSLHNLSNFLETSIPTRQLAAFVTAVVVAAIQPTGVFSSTALVAAVVTGGAALALGLVADIATKVAGLNGTPTPPPAK